MTSLLHKSLRFAITVSLITALIAVFFSLSSTTLMAGLSWGGGILVLLAIVVIGILFDMLGIAAAAAKEKPFHAMAAKRIPGAKEAIGIVRRADQFSSFCNDVVGDISGVISGSASFAVVTSLIATFPEWGKQRWLIDVVLVSIISALTVGGKALAKTVSIHYSNQIIYQVGKVFYWVNRKLHMSLFHVKSNKKRKRKRGVLRAPRTN
jgi:CBS domain containing-hemolysin-like protein